MALEFITLTAGIPSAEALGTPIVNGVVRGRSTGLQSSRGFTRTLDDTYADVLCDLLPPGAAWPRDQDTTLFKLLLGIGLELAFIEHRLQLLIDEADPRTTVELLPDWERIAGLPDPCFTPTTIAERQDQLVLKITGRGGLRNAQFYIDLAARIGILVTVTDGDKPPFVAGSLAGDFLYSSAWRFVVTILAIDGKDTELLRCILPTHIQSHIILVTGNGILPTSIPSAEAIGSHTVT